MLDVDSFEALLTLDMARRSRDLHDVDTGGRCRLCLPSVAWPCPPFERAQRTIGTLTGANPATWARCCDEYVHAVGQEAP